MGISELPRRQTWQHLDISTLTPVWVCNSSDGEVEGGWLFRKANVQRGSNCPERCGETIIVYRCLVIGRVHSGIVLGLHKRVQDCLNIATKKNFGVHGHQEPPEHQE